MSTCSLDVDSGQLCGRVAETAMSTEIRGLLASLSLHDRGLERRHDRRYAYPHLIRLLPVAADGFTPAGRPAVVVGKYLSERGLGFFHQEPLAHRRMIVTLEGVDGVQLSLLADLNWCRFTGSGWYESGGRFLDVVDM